MAFTLIKGTYHVVGYSPDGDSIRFRAADAALWAKLSGPPANVNARGHAQLRLDAIDTLETHFQNVHQPLGLATAALEFLLAHLGITEVEWDASRTKVTSANDGVPGYVLSREVEKNRRPVAFAFAGEAEEDDGASVFLTPARLAASVNLQSLEAGFAFPTYYKGLFPDLRDTCTATVATARAGGLGVWAEDVTNTGFEVTGLGPLTTDLVILPKLFRRLAAYLETGGGIAGFLANLAALNEEIVIVSTAHVTHFDTVVDVEGNTVTMTEPPENLIFMG
jgi:hypothetical protein